MLTYWPKPPVVAPEGAYWDECAWRHLNVIATYFWFHRVLITRPNFLLLMEDPFHPAEIARLIRERRREFVSRSSEWSSQGQAAQVERSLAVVIDYCDDWERTPEAKRRTILDGCREAVRRHPSATEIIEPGLPWWPQ